MNKIKLLLVAPIILTSGIVQAQNEDDAYRLSKGTPQSTALSLSMGGVGASMGGDFNTLSINPSGIGVYRSGELMITPVYKFGNNNSTLVNTAMDSRNGRLNLANVGIVFHRNIYNSRWKSFAVGLGMNTIANYNENIFAQGESDKTSITDVFSQSAKDFGTTEQTVPPYGFLGYQGYLLDNNLNSVIPTGTALLHTKNVKHTGSKKEYTLTLGGNYNEKLLIGATLGINSVDYVRHTTNLEKDISGNVDNNFDNLELTERISTSGLGANVKFGATYVVNPSLKLGVAMHTPTWMTLTDLMDYRLESNTENYKRNAGFTDKNPISVAIPEKGYQYTYSMSTPWRFVAGATGIIGNSGMLSIDYEYTPYQSMRYRMDNDKAYETIVNKNIQAKYTAAHSIRAGGELAMDNLFLRAGAGYHTSPYKQSSTLGGARTDLSIGAGMRFDYFFIDLGYMHSRMKRSELLHDLSSTNSLNPVIDARGSQNQIALTLGFKFRK